MYSRLRSLWHVGYTPPHVACTESRDRIWKLLRTYELVIGAAPAARAQRHTYELVIGAAPAVRPKKLFDLVFTCRRQAATADVLKTRCTTPVRCTVLVGQYRIESVGRDCRWSLIRCRTLVASSAAVEVLRYSGRESSWTIAWWNIRFKILDSRVVIGIKEVIGWIYMWIWLNWVLSARKYTLTEHYSHFCV